MDFEKICMLFTMQEPYYGIILSSMERIPTPGFGTLGVGRSGNVFKLYYDPAFIEQFNTDTITSFLKHEVLHVAFNHFSLWENENVSHEIHRLRNIAEDMEINSYLDRSKIEKKAGGSFAEDLGWEKKAGTREYFRRLMQKNDEMKKQKAQAKNPEQPCNGGLGNNEEENNKDTEQSQNNEQNTEQCNEQSSQQQETGNESGESSGISAGFSSSDTQSNAGTNSSNGTEEVAKELLDQFSSFDDHSQWPDSGNEEEQEQLQQVIDDMLVMAAEEVVKGQGRIPDEMAIQVSDILNKRKSRPVANWRRYFRRYLGNEFTELIRKSKKRESKRFPDAAGNRHQRKSRILVAVDTSGSVSMPEYREFFGQINTLMSSANIHVIECDMNIQHEYDYNGKPNDTLHGGGGTDFSPVIDYYLKEKKKYDALVYFTDGFAEIPKNTPKDTLWVISSNGYQIDRKRYKINGASVVFIPKNK